MVNVFGATGYIGTRFCQMYDSVAQPRNSLIPMTNQVLYMISTTHNHHLNTNPWIDIDTNITHLLRVLEYTRQRGHTEFNFVSSWFVYGHTTQPKTENDACSPQGFYSVTKRAAEQLLMEYCEHHGIGWRIMRLCNVIGGQDTKAGSSKNVLHNSIRLMQQGLPVCVINQGQFLRDYLHRDDVCAAVNFIIQHGSINQIYNIGSGHQIYFREVLDFALQLSGSRSTIENQVQHNVIDCVMDCSRLRDLGWRPAHTWQWAVQDILQHFS